MRCGAIGLGLAALLLMMPAQGRPRADPPLIDREVSAPGGGTMLMTIARPKTRVRRPAVLILHGTHGFADEYVTLARDVASAGFVGVAACWFAPGQGKGMRFVTPRACPAATPPLTDGDTREGLARAAALVEAVAGLPGVDPNRIVLMGHSRGAVAAMYHALDQGRACGIILNSGAYPPDAVERAASIGVPALILHGNADDASQGGSPMTAPARARAFVRSLQQAGKRVDVKFYENGNHNSLFLDPRQHRLEVAEIVRFMGSIAPCGAHD